MSSNHVGLVPFGRALNQLTVWPLAGGSDIAVARKIVVVSMSGR